MRTNINKANFNWKYNLVKGINLVHYHDRIYVPKTVCTRVSKWYHFYLQHPDCDRLPQTLLAIFRLSGIVEQEPKICKTCKYFQKFKKRNSKYGLLPAKDSETLKTKWHTVCVDPIVTYTILAKVMQPDNNLLTKELQLLCMKFSDLAAGWFEIA